MALFLLNMTWKNARVTSRFGIALFAFTPPERERLSVPPCLALQDDQGGWPRLYW
jgi:hypothetical protein